MNAAPLMANFSMEILEKIFENLTPNEAVKCRAVCKSWKFVIDDMLDRDKVWKEKCKRDFQNLHNNASVYSRVGIVWWRILYESLCMAPKLTHATEMWGRNLCGSEDDEIVGVHAWRGTAAVHKHQTIEYYDVEKLKQVNCNKIGHYLMFEENERVSAYMQYVDSELFRNLRIISKTRPKWTLFKKSIEIKKVNNFLVVNEEVYYNQWTRDPTTAQFIYVCRVKDNFKCSLLGQIEGAVYGFSYNQNCLSCLTFDETIYTLVDKELVLSVKMIKENTFDSLCKYNLLERAEFSAWTMDSVGITCRVGYLEFTTVRVWGDVVLAGTKEGVLKIYRRESFYANKNISPLKEYDLKVLFKLVNHKINGIDIVAGDSCYNVIISTPYDVIILHLAY